MSTVMSYITTAQNAVKFNMLTAKCMDESNRQCNINNIRLLKTDKPQLQTLKYYTQVLAYTDLSLGRFLMGARYICLPPTFLHL